MGIGLHHPFEGRNKNDNEQDAVWVDQVIDGRKMESEIRGMKGIPESGCKLKKC